MPSDIQTQALYRSHYYDEPVRGTFGDRLRRSKALLPTLAVALVAVGALAATLVVRDSGAMNDPQRARVEAPVETVPAQRLAAAPQPTPASRAPLPAAGNAPEPMAQAPVCGNCGTVESVQAVQRPGQASGVGAVAGGVLGGVLGNQVGGGSGRTAMTVLGAAGGGYAGHQIEKNIKKTTSYRVRVRMQDGSLRTLDQGSAPAAGSPVVVEGGVARVARASAAVRGA